MTNLLPVESWKYSLRDVLSGLAAAPLSSRPVGTLRVDRIGECLPVRSARVGLVAVLRALNLTAGAHVGVPLYCCPVVFKAICACGAIPYFIDVDERSMCLSPEDLYKKRGQVEAVIAVHMFGHLCDMAAVQEAAEGRPVIEDCAQSLGSTFQGRMTGSFGRVGVFSFRSGKFLSVGEGGALFTFDEPLRTRLCEVIESMPTPTWSDEVTHVAATFVRSNFRSRPLYGMIGEALWKAYNKTVQFAAKTPIVLTRAYHSDLVLIKRRLARLAEVIADHRVNAQMYLRLLELPSAMLRTEPENSFYNRYLFPIVFSSASQRDWMACHLRRRQIAVARPYADIAQVAAAHFGYVGDCPTAEKIASTVLVLPSYSGLQKRQMERIAKAVNEGWAHLNGRRADTT